MQAILTTKVFYPHLDPWRDRLIDAGGPGPRNTSYETGWRNRLTGAGPPKAQRRAVPEW
jgi:hypothetical protein